MSRRFPASKQVVVVVDGDTAGRIASTVLLVLGRHQVATGVYGIEAGIFGWGDLGTERTA